MRTRRTAPATAPAIIGINVPDFDPVLVGTGGAVGEGVDEDEVVEVAASK